MKTPLANPTEVLAIGEILGDFIGNNLADSLYDTATFNRFWGGSPANFASNLNKLGISSKVVGCLGNENLGKYLKAEIAKTGLETDLIKSHPSLPSSIVLVSRTTGSPDFIPYRMADSEIELEDIPLEVLKSVKVVHTTCWPLSRKPSQSTLLQIAQNATKLSIQLSIDLNYAEPVWPNREEAHSVLADFIAHGAWLKLSEDDAHRYWGQKLPDSEIIKNFQKLGAGLVVLTKGSQGAVIAEKNKEPIFKAAENTSVIDATGAGDAYWAGFVAAKLRGKSVESCAESGTKMAQLKLQTLGPLSKDLNYSHII